MIDERLRRIAAAQPRPLLFATMSGAHLYGFASPDSDFDLRGVHMLSCAEVVGLDTGPETVEVSDVVEGLDLDLVTHDLRKFVGLMLRPSGFVLEQLFSPLIVVGGAAHDELRELGRGCVTRHHLNHYLGFFHSQWQLFEKEPRLKGLLYGFRVLLTGIHLMRTGEVEADLGRLLSEADIPFLPELIERKRAGAEKQALLETDLDRYRRAVAGLEETLRSAAERTSLPDRPSTRPALNDFLIRRRLATLATPAAATRV